jgi:hypothetical protein
VPIRKNVYSFVRLNLCNIKTGAHPSGWDDVGRFNAKAGMINASEGIEVMFEFAPHGSFH